MKPKKSKIAYLRDSGKEILSVVNKVPVQGIIGGYDFKDDTLIIAVTKIPKKHKDKVKAWAYAERTETSSIRRQSRKHSKGFLYVSLNYTLI